MRNRIDPKVGRVPLVIRIAFASALRETGLQLPSGEKAREVRPSLLDNPFFAVQFVGQLSRTKGMFQVFRGQRLSRYEVNLVGTLKVKGNIDTATGKHLFLPSLLSNRALSPFRRPVRRKGFAAVINAPDGIPRPWRVFSLLIGLSTHKSFSMSDQPCCHHSKITSCLPAARELFVALP
jgi:hypothetical protein